MSNPAYKEVNFQGRIIDDQRGNIIYKVNIIYVKCGRAIMICGIDIRKLHCNNSLCGIGIMEIIELIKEEFKNNLDTIFSNKNIFISGEPFYN
ncbi:hypothetical protein COX95_01695 [bacterium CG_4_10_14_0_2_um_filter_33_32]|nr:MAG: hypothetical protein AUJ93_01645 [bacterium CG2_30_33_46]PIR67835.1 MAG: hypothetical protein COU50_01215 [bacterium CG10_big_fil_rev_8_21_14_0_10_33_18]PIU76481.1 MAG: hypothetical protein COS74_03840 [bacterium CG06_land_8_20_14_3_00_33_50]PIW81356.1 MAG: hypothetical protein COZ97_02225 [bacterium CG_4_8_14_3_um_filter_33_28]PIY85185.1 MAG: hypothetical protein COY76_03470 [bacterium CG_4_10_14_0_8_um_filter_33_57]PIZ86309.1 MAG: hypothetical protein COX95_01695 [bacterium CG_4_10_1